MALGLTVWVLQAVSPSVTIGDSRLSVVSAWSLVTRGTFRVGRYPAVRALTDRYDLIRVHGHLEPFFPWPPMLLALPGDVLLRLAGHHPGRLSIASPGRTALVEVPTAALLVALTFVALRAAASRSGWSSRAATATALLYAFATSAWSIGSRALWQQTASMLWLSCMLLALVGVPRSGQTSARRWAALGLTGGLAVICRPSDLPFAAGVLLWAVCRHRWRAYPAVLSMSTVAVVFLAVSRSAYGDWVPPYYSIGRFNHPIAVPFLDGLAYNLVSPSRGLLWFDPVLVLAAVGLFLSWRRRAVSPAIALAAGTVPVQLLVIALYGSDGGTVYGPRLMLDIVPYLCYLSLPVVELALSGQRRLHSPVRRPAAAAALVVSVVVWGLFVNGTGALLRSSRCWSIVPVSVDVRPSRAWSWSDPQWLWPWRQLAAGGSLVDVERPVCRL